jgi:regulatory protein
VIRRRSQAGKGAGAPLSGRPPAPAGDEQARARGAALALLSRREYAEDELRRALLRKGLEEDAVAGALGSLRGQRYLDDTSLAVRYARSRMQFQGQGQHRIRRGLRQKGVPRAIIEEGIREAAGEVSEAEVLDRLARRYWTQRQKLAPARRVQGLWAFLLRRGFPAALVHDRLRALWPRWSDALAGLDAGTVEEE